jgi:hypothetical protein
MTDTVKNGTSLMSLKGGLVKIQARQVEEQQSCQNIKQLNNKQKLTLKK